MISAARSPAPAFCRLLTASCLPNRGPKMGSEWPAVRTDRRVSKVPTEQPDGDEGIRAENGQKTGSPRRPAGHWTKSKTGRLANGARLPPHTPDSRPGLRRK